MAESMALLKPAPLKVKKDGDPEHLLRKFNDYMKKFDLFLLTTEVGGVHTAGHAAEAGGGQCKGCVKSKAMLQLVGGEEMMTLFEHTGMVEDGDSYTAAVDKIREGIKGQTNQASARFKLFQQMPQAGQPFARWYTRIKEQADRVDWTVYNAKTAARDAILFQTDDKKLMKKIMAEDITFDETVKAGLAYEQGARKVEEIRGKDDRKEVEKVARLDSLEEMVRSLKAEMGTDSNACKMCTFVHREGQRCPAKGKECLACGQTGHFVNSAVCKGKEKRVQKEKARAVLSETSDTDTGSESNTESVGRVKEIPDEVEKVENVEKDNSETAEIKMTVMDHKNPSKEVEIDFLVDSGVNKTLLSERDWKRVKPKINGKAATLKKSHTKFSAFGTKQKLPILGRTRCRLVARCGQEFTTIVYVVEGETQSLLGLRDSKALGILSIQPEGRHVKKAEPAVEEKGKINSSMEEGVSRNPVQGRAKGDRQIRKLVVEDKEQAEWQEAGGRRRRRSRRQEKQ
jgi:hypothetical protein